MRRRLFNILAAVWLAMVTVLIVMWVRSQSTVDFFGSRTVIRDKNGLLLDQCRGIASVEGVLVIGKGSHWWLETGLPEGWPFVLPPLQQQSGWNSWRYHWRGNGVPICFYNWRDNENVFGFATFFETAQVPAEDEITRRTMWIPYWFLISIVMVIPVGRVLISLARRIQHYVDRRRRAHVGLCARCGYDLRASTDRCPECGTAIRIRPTQQGTTL